MSIIYDALKKIETADRGAGEGIKAPQRIFRVKPKINSYLLQIAGICVGLGLIWLLSGLVKHSDNPPACIATMSKASAVKPLSQDAAPAVSDSFLNSFVVSGVFFSENEGYALINDRIVREGDSINGAILRRIGLDEVELDNKGEKIVLSAK